MRDPWTTPGRIPLRQVDDGGHDGGSRLLRERVEHLLGRSVEGWFLGTFHAVAARILRPEELALLCRQRRPEAWLAKCFAAKEALAKALGTGIGAVSWQDFAVLPQPGGAPQVHSHGRARKLFAERGVTGVWISLSDEREQALAFALLSGG